MAKQKCKYCLEELDKKDKFIFIEKTANGKDKRINLHNECVGDYNELMEYKKNELYWFNEVYEQLMELLGYSSEQKLPKSLITRVQDLRNGTVMKRGEGRVIKSKDGYRYEIIFDCLLACGDKIRWAMDNKSFKTENTKINYLMAIVEGGINDSYVLFESRERNNSNGISNSIIEEAIKMEEIIKEKPKQEVIIVKKQNTGISKFLDEDDF